MLPFLRIGQAEALQVNSSLAHESRCLPGLGFNVHPSVYQSYVLPGRMFGKCGKQ